MTQIPQQMHLGDVDADYRAFVDKFKPKRTTDDCLTPQPVYEAVLAWVRKEYHLEGAPIIRPFWPGADFEREAYPEGCAVVDNPPFSILAHIVRTYQAAGIRFFLFGPQLTIFNATDGVCAITTSAGITYENGACVATSFLTNMEPGLAVRTAPDLTRIVNEADAENQRAKKGEPLPKYVYPYELLTAARAAWLSKWGQDLRVPAAECQRVGALDAQRAVGKGVFGGGLLLSERAAAERAAAYVWELSPREREIVRMLAKTAQKPENDR